MTIARCHRHDMIYNSERQNGCIKCTVSGLSNDLTQEGLEGLLQDVSEMCDATRIALADGHTRITHNNRTAWNDASHKLSLLFDELKVLHADGHNDNAMY